MSAYDREVEFLEQQLADRSISQKEFNDQMQEMARDLEEQAQEAGEEAYHNFLGY